MGYGEEDIYHEGKVQINVVFFCLFVCLTGCECIKEAMQTLVVQKFTLTGITILL